MSSEEAKKIVERQKNLSRDDRSTMEMLVELGQAHLFEPWADPKVDDDKKHDFLEQIRQINSTYPGGITKYVTTAREKFASFKSGSIPHQDYIPSPPPVTELEPGTDLFNEAEARGMAEMKNTAFVLLAGGETGDVAKSPVRAWLPTELSSRMPLLKTVGQFISVIQEKVAAEDSSVVVPWCVMTSDANHKHVQEIFDLAKYFGLKQNVTFVTQNLVPSLIDVDARLFTKPSQPYTLPLVPHGHGDVLGLLYSSGLMKSWLDGGVKWIVVLSDHNIQSLRAIPGLVGTAAIRNCAMNILTTPRMPGEALGSVVQVIRKRPVGQPENSVRNQLVVVEPSFLNQYLRASGLSYGDAPTAEDSTVSPFPANTGVCVLATAPCYAVLDKALYVATISFFDKVSNATSAIVDVIFSSNVAPPYGFPTTAKYAIPEAAIPDFATSVRSRFRNPVALRTFVQDISWILEETAVVMATQMPRPFCFSPMINSIPRAISQQHATGYALCAATAEADVYHTNRRILASVGVRIDPDGPIVSHSGISVVDGAHVVLLPSFGVTQNEIKSRFVTPEQVVISSRSTLVLEGNITFENMILDGALAIRAVPGAHVTVRNVKAINKGWSFQDIPQSDDNILEAFSIRGYTVEAADIQEFSFRTPGEHLLEDIFFHAKGMYEEVSSDAIAQMQNVEDSIEISLSDTPASLQTILFPNASNKWPLRRLPPSFWPAEPTQAVAKDQLFQNSRKLLRESLEVLSRHPLFVPLPSSSLDLEEIVPESDAVAEELLTSQTDEGAASNEVVTRRQIVRDVSVAGMRPTPQLPRLIFLCPDNTWLSLYAEAIANISGSTSRVVVHSAAAIATGKCVMSMGLEVMADLGLDFKSCRCKHIKLFDPKDFDMVVLLNCRPENIPEPWQTIPRKVEVMELSNIPPTFVSEQDRQALRMFTVNVLKPKVVSLLQTHFLNL
eukprot:c11542_g1_i1.p1 GENE.c11542_g1_i1~~c11542_g1_i1.p1  ORF type:complete len:952 (-),score=243.57 c11542_g1_i1:88-2943(-)